MRQKILKQVGVLLTVSILLTFLVVSLTMYSKFNGYMHDSVREEAEYIRVTRAAQVLSERENQQSEVG